MEPIVTVTVNPTIDISTQVGHVVSDKKLRCARPKYEPGGGGINVSRAIKKLGGDSTTLFTAGGTGGERLRRLLAEEEISQQIVSIGEATRENIIVFETQSDKQYRFTMPGPQLAEAEWKQCLEDLKNLDPKPAYLIGSGSLAQNMPDDFYGRMAEIAADLGARCIVDTSNTPLVRAAQKGVYLLKPNMREIQELVGEEIQDEHDQERLVMKLLDEGYAQVIVLSLGTAGALVASKEGTERLRAPSVSIKSRVGAGDSMVAGIVLKLAQGDSLRNAVRFGIAAGSAAVMTPGTELCRREDAERLYAKMAEDEGREASTLETPDFSDVSNVRR
ncbi:hexose kinase [candidate division KSB3 bacterium]|uniref:Hexose kinase n=1 Tax=candidate division KSB3 bacterium TaxID=2044937 RepID=A0A9D5JWY5_9BACT|nr:hexose kinase [candidate division KSB3 bacterium]MBD3325763.1 hexose kinase [candidate division KSB3 bacterium]